MTNSTFENIPPTVEHSTEKKEGPRDEIKSQFISAGFEEDTSTSVLAGGIALRKTTLLVRITPNALSPSGLEISFLDTGAEHATPDTLKMRLRKAIGATGRYDYEKEKIDPVTVLESSGKFKKGKNQGITSGGMTFFIEEIKQENRPS